MEYTPLQEELLKTLSFMEPMSLEFVLLDMDKNFLENHPEVTTKNLLEELLNLKQLKKLKLIKKEGQTFWIKIFPKRPWYKRIFI